MAPNLGLKPEAVSLRLFETENDDSRSFRREKDAYKQQALSSGMVFVPRGHSIKAHRFIGGSRRETPAKPLGGETEFSRRVPSGNVALIRWVAPVDRLRATGVAQSEEVAIIQPIEAAPQLTVATQAIARNFRSNPWAWPPVG